MTESLEKLLEKSNSLRRLNTDSLRSLLFMIIEVIYSSRKGVEFSHAYTSEKS